MKYILLIKRNLFLMLGALGVLTTGCIKEELDACKNEKLVFKVENEKGQEITELGLVKDASLYFFDENQNFVEKRKIDLDFILGHKEIELKNYPSNKKLQIVAWGNLGDETNQTVNDAETIDELKLMLKSSNGIAQGAPDSLYYGKKEVTTIDGGVNKPDTVAVRLRIATFTIKTIGLENAPKALGLKSTDETFEFGLTNTLDAYDANGVEAGKEVGYQPSSKEDNREGFEWMSTGNLDKTVSGRRLTGGKQNIFTGEDLSLTFSRDGKQLATVTVGQDFETGETVPISFKQGERRDLFIEFAKDGTISLKMKITPWGVVDDNIEL